MFTKITEQLTEQITTAMKTFTENQQVSTALKPLNGLVEINRNTVEKLIGQQTDLITSILKGSVAQAKVLSSATDIKESIEAQKLFNSVLTEKVSNAAKESQAIVTENSKNILALVESTMSPVEEVKEPVKEPVKATK